MTYLTLGPEDLDEHHLCCALGDPKHRAGVEAKRAWLRSRMAEGLVFRKLDVRGKVFIEYAPAEVAWRPVVAPGFLVVHCLWVSGRFAKQGHGRALLRSCMDDAERQGKAGVVVASAKRKRPFLADPRFLARMGFEVVDVAGEWRLYAWRGPAGRDARVPRLAEAVHRGAAAPTSAGSFVATVTDQCPFNRHWAEVVASDLRAAGHEARVRSIDTVAEAQQVASPLGAYGLTRGEGLVAHHLTTTKATGRLVGKLG